MGETGVAFYLKGGVSGTFCVKGGMCGVVYAVGQAMDRSTWWVGFGGVLRVGGASETFFVKGGSVLGGACEDVLRVGGRVERST